MYIPKRKVVCAMITEIDFRVKGEERKKLAYAIGELLGMPVKYTRTPKFDYLIGSSILDKKGVFHASEDLTESKLELVLERFYKGEPIQQSEQSENEIVAADVLSISVQRTMLADDKLENLQKLIEGKQTLFKHAFLTEQLEVVITENQVSFPWFPLASEPDAVNAYTEFISTTIYLWLISLTASKELSILLLKLYNDGAIGISFPFLGLCVRSLD